VSMMHMVAPSVGKRGDYAGVNALCTMAECVFLLSQYGRENAKNTINKVKQTNMDMIVMVKFLIVI